MNAPQVETPHRHITEPLVRVLEGTLAGGEAVGGKAAALDRLIHWGVPVPGAVVATAAAYRAVAAAPEIGALLDRLDRDSGIPASEIDATFYRVGLPAGLAEQLCVTVTALAGDRPVAVRSSATVEDMNASSFAGQYESVLDIDPRDPAVLERAVLTVFASLHHPAPRSYRRALGIPEEGVAMAALIMPMVAAVRSGVLFTQDPTGAEGATRIETVTGIAESLVSGKQTPEVLLVDGESVAESAGPEISRLLPLAREIERRAGCPQDLEWAWDGRRVWIVQARPITVVAGEQDPFDTPPALLEGREFTTAGIAEMLPGVLPPLRWDLCSYWVDTALRDMLSELGGAPEERPGEGHRLLERVHGRAALDSVAVGPAVATGASGKPGRIDSFRHHRRAAAVRRRAGFEAEVVIEAAREIEAATTDVDTLPDGALARYHFALVDLVARAMSAEIAVAANAGAIHAGLRMVLDRALTATEAHRLAAEVTAPAFYHGPSRRASMAVPSGPTWFEEEIEPPAAPPPAARAAVIDEVIAAVEAAKPANSAGRWLRSRRIERLATEAAIQLERRERTKRAILLLGGEIRRIHLAVGRRWAAAGLLSTPADVEHLTAAEFRRALHGRGLPPSVVLDRRRRWARRQAQQEPLPPVFRGVPEPATAAAVIEGKRLTGWANGAGRFRGIARFRTDPSRDIGPDEVLVAVTTDPSWSPLLMRCGAMVIEQGGPLSHAAILAREFGVPAVFNLPGAARAIDGRRVEVDGDTGTVTILEEGTGDELANS
ncbi:PEP/pyruvate-binding domain-containing protein [Nocardia carnea]|uniref:PEP/pyruvate-binding domain-containing protein n=1 Tax=Nocardia carnea TaxID=37328 RepID=UPI002454FEC7|nr:PEP/pyruvate-binding domain-containing protein [Nocardia carnea]